MNPVNGFTEEQLLRHLSYYPFRFRTETDASKAILYLQKREPIPKDLIIDPFVKVGDEVVPNPDYEDAAFELRAIKLEKQTVVYVKT